MLVAIQVIDSTFGFDPLHAPKRIHEFSEAGLNGILGVGLFAEDDCGRGYSGGAENVIYYACSGAHRLGTTVFSLRIPVRLEPDSVFPPGQQRNDSAFVALKNLK